MTISKVTISSGILYQRKNSEMDEFEDLVVAEKLDPTVIGKLRKIITELHTVNVALKARLDSSKEEIQRMNESTIKEIQRKEEATIKEIQRNEESTNKEIQRIIDMMNSQKEEKDKEIIRLRTVISDKMKEILHKPVDHTSGLCRLKLQLIF